MGRLPSSELPRTAILLSARFGVSGTDKVWGAARKGKSRSWTSWVTKTCQTGQWNSTTRCLMKTPSFDPLPVKHPDVCPYLRDMLTVRAVLHARCKIPAAHVKKWCCQGETPMTGSL